MRSRKKKRVRIRTLVLLIGIVIAAGYVGICSGFDWEEKFEDGYPKSLVELAERNPETVDFVKHYKDYDGSSEDIDISDEVEEGTIPLFLQWDERWGYEKYGGDYMAVNGCGPTCLSMVVCGLRGNTEMNPLKVAKLAESEGYYVRNAGSSWTMMDILASELGLEVEYLTFDEKCIVDTLNEGKPIICVVGPGDFTNEGHFIVLTGTDEKGRITVNDPNSRKNSHKAWNPETLVPQILNLWCYS